MSTLHIIRRSISTHSSIKNSIELLSKGDVVVFIDDGIYNINDLIYQEIYKVISSTNIYVVVEHAQARGISIPDNMSAITIKEILGLSLSTTQSITWQ